jgi:hypothetical protein
MKRELAKARSQGMYEFRTRALVITLCLILIVVKASGAHASLLHPHAPASACGTRDSQITSLPGEGAVDDCSTHVDRGHHPGSTNLPDHAKASTKCATLKFTVPFVSCHFIVRRPPAPKLAVQYAQSLVRPPAWRSRAFLTPPSHAPPLTA